MSLWCLNLDQLLQMCTRNIYTSLFVTLLFSFKFKLQFNLLFILSWIIVFPVYFPQPKLILRAAFKKLDVFLIGSMLGNIFLPLKSYILREIVYTGPRMNWQIFPERKATDFNLYWSCLIGCTIIFYLQRQCFSVNSFYNSGMKRWDPEAFLTILDVASHEQWGSDYFSLLEVSFTTVSIPRFLATIITGDKTIS